MNRHALAFPAIGPGSRGLRRALAKAQHTVQIRGEVHGVRHADRYRVITGVAS